MCYSLSRKCDETIGASHPTSARAAETPHGQRIYAASSLFNYGQRNPAPLAVPRGAQDRCGSPSTPISLALPRTTTPNLNFHTLLDEIPNPVSLAFARLEKQKQKLESHSV